MNRKRSSLEHWLFGIVVKTQRVVAYTVDMLVPLSITLLVFTTQGYGIGFGNSSIFYTPLKDPLERKGDHHPVPTTDFVIAFFKYTNTQSYTYAYNVPIYGYLEFYRYKNLLSVTFTAETELVTYVSTDLHHFYPRALFYELDGTVHLSSKIGYWLLAYSHHCKHNIDSVDYQIDKVIEDQIHNDKPDDMLVPKGWPEDRVEKMPLDLERNIVLDGLRLKFISFVYPLWRHKVLSSRVQATSGLTWFFWNSDWYTSTYKFVYFYGVEWTVLSWDHVLDIYAQYVGHGILKGYQQRNDFRIFDSHHDVFMELGIRFPLSGVWMLFCFDYEHLFDTYILQTPEKKDMWRMGLRFQSFY